MCVDLNSGVKKVYFAPFMHSFTTNSNSQFIWAKYLNLIEI